MWKILEIQAAGELITAARYFCTEAKGDNTVETEGWWHFAEPALSIPFADVTEEMVVEWVKKDAIQFGKNIIESRLTEQLEALAKPKVLPPWVSQVFTLGE